MLKRDIWDKLTDWKNRKHHPLVIKGLRQCGKTYIARHLGEEQYENCVYVDLRADQKVHRAFDGDFNVDQMVMAITATNPAARFLPGKTLLIWNCITTMRRAGHRSWILCTKKTER